MSASDHTYAPYLPDELVHRIFAEIPSGEAGTLANMPGVCQQWWHVGHGCVWSECYDQLYGLLYHVTDPNRRQKFASLVNRINLFSSDMILADTRTPLPQLEFPRLETLRMYLSNLRDIDPANIQALMSPSLRTFILDFNSDDWRGDIATDINTLFTALMMCSSTLTKLDLGFDDQLPDVAYQGLRALLGSMSAIKYLDLESPGGFINDVRGSDLLSLLLFNKSELIDLTFPGSTFLSKLEVDKFLLNVGPTWSAPALRVINSGVGKREGLSLRDSRAPTFTSSRAAAHFLDRMPNLEFLSLKLCDVDGFPFGHQASGENVMAAFDAISKLTHLEAIQLKIQVQDCNLRGDWLVSLGSLKKLESLYMIVVNDQPGLVTDVQMVSFLTGLPKLDFLTIRGLKTIVSCSPENLIIIRDALARIGFVDLGTATFGCRLHPNSDLRPEVPT